MALNGICRCASACGHIQQRDGRWVFVDLVGKATTHTGHPSLTLRAGFVEVSEPRSDWGAGPRAPAPQILAPSTGASRRYAHWSLFDEGTIGRAGLALERALNVEAERPAGF